MNPVDRSQETAAEQPAEREPEAVETLGRSGVQRGVGLLLALLTLASVWTVYRPILDLELNGWDTYPMILTSRVQSAGDLVENFSEELMDGRYPHAHFYRPLSNLSLALDYAIWGLDPFGYHLTDLLLLLGAGAALFGLGRRHLVHPVLAWFALLFFLLHPLQLESVPVTARRADSLALLLTLGALLVQVPRSARPGILNSLLAALLAALAVGAKEAGAVVLPLIFGYHLVVLSHGPLAQRIRAGLAAVWLPAIAVVAVLVARSVVLGGVGGYNEPPSAGSGAERWLLILGALPRSLLAPRPISTEAWIRLAWVWGLGLSLVCLSAWAVLRARGGRAGGGPPRERAPGPWLLFLACWLLGLLGIPVVSGGFQWWYGIPALAPLGLLLACLGDQLGVRAREGEARPVLLVAGLALAMGFFGPLRFSPVAHAYPEWEALSAQEASFLQAFRQAVVRARPGSSLVIKGLPLQQPPMARVGVQSAFGLSSYGVQSYGDLLFPDRRVRVVQGNRPPPARAGEIRIAVEPRRLGGPRGGRPAAAGSGGPRSPSDRAGTRPPGPRPSQDPPGPVIGETPVADLVPFDE